MSPTSPRGSLLAARRPRVDVVPPYAYTVGPEACELARRAGLVADPWQADGVDALMGVRADGLWACYEYGEIVPRQNGKGTLLEIRALAGFLLLGEQLIMWSAHEYKTAIRAFRRVRMLLRRLGRQVGVSENLIEVDGIRIKILNTNGEEGFERLDTGAELKFIARSKSSGRGFSGDLVIIDETFAYTTAQQEALQPTMSARPNAQIVYTSTPPLDGESGEVMFALRKRAEDGDDSLGWRDWGAAGDLDNLDDIDLDDRELWAATNPATGIRITVETMLRERRSMSDRGFARERLAVWPRRTLGGGSIDPAAWAKLADATSRRAGGVAIGVDIAPLRDYAAIAVYGLREDELGHGQVVDYRAGTDWLIDRIVEVREALDPVAVGMGRGTAKSLETELAKRGITKPEDPAEPKRGDLAVTAAADMAAACGQLLDAVRHGTLRYVPARQLDIAVAGAKIRQTSDTVAWSRTDVDVDTSPLVALTVARWAYETRAHLIVDYDVADSFG